MHYFDDLRYGLKKNEDLFNIKLSSPLYRKMVEMNLMKLRIENSCIANSAI